MSTNFELDDLGRRVVSSLATVLEKLCQRNDSIPLDHRSITKFHALRPPQIGVRDYLDRIGKFAACSGPCFVLSLIYVDRIIVQHNFVVNSLNVHRLVITAVMLAAKFFDDQFFKNTYYAKVGGVPCHELNNLEVEFLFLANFNLYVGESEYKQYISELFLQVGDTASIRELEKMFPTARPQQPQQQQQQPQPQQPQLQHRVVGQQQHPVPPPTAGGPAAPPGVVVGHHHAHAQHPHAHAIAGNGRMPMRANGGAGSTAAGAPGAGGGPPPGMARAVASAAGGGRPPFRDAAAYYYDEMTMQSPTAAVASTQAQASRPQAMQHANYNHQQFRRYEPTHAVRVTRSSNLNGGCSGGCSDCNSSTSGGSSSSPDSDAGTSGISAASTHHKQQQRQQGYNRASQAGGPTFGSHQHLHQQHLHRGGGGHVAPLYVHGASGAAAATTSGEMHHYHAVAAAPPQVVMAATGVAGYARMAVAPSTAMTTAAPPGPSVWRGSSAGAAGFQGFHQAHYGYPPQ